MNLAERLLQFDESEITEELLTTIEECDIPKMQEKKIEKELNVQFNTRKQLLLKLWNSAHLLNIFPARKVLFISASSIQRELKRFLTL